MNEKQTEIRVDIGGLHCCLGIPLSANAVLARGDVWKGEVIITPPSPLFRPPIKKSTRMSAIVNETAQKGQHRNVLRATVPERQVIRGWNRSKYMRALDGMSKEERDPRNNPVVFKEISIILPLVKKCLRDMGVTEILRHMETYFDFCSMGEHIWEGKSHGFKSLSGFLEKLLVLHKTKEKPWWDTRATSSRAVVDDNAKLTIRIANSFAQTYMKEQKFPLESGSKDHANFVHAAQKIVSFINRKKRQGVELTQADMIKYLLEFIDVTFSNYGDPVYSTHLASDAVWSSLPAFLSEKGVI